jgi:hypothetical protein
MYECKRRDKRGYILPPIEQPRGLIMKLAYYFRYALTFVGCVLAVLFGIPALYPLFEKRKGS